MIYTAVDLVHTMRKTFDIDVALPRDECHGADPSRSKGILSWFSRVVSHVAFL